MKSHRFLIAFIALTVLASMCVCAASAGYIAYRVIGEQAVELLRDPSILFDSQPIEPEEILETQTPFGAEIDLHRLFSPFWESRTILHEEFVDQPIDDALLAQGAVAGLTSALEDLGISLDDIDLPATAPDPASLSAEAGTPSEVEALFADFWQIWSMAQFANLEGQITYEELMRAALSGMVDALGDQHTGYMDPDELRQSALSLEGEYEGIGAWVDTTTEYLTIVAAMENSPAAAAGLRPGDRVLAIDGEDMTGIDGNAVISRILGPAGSTVVLTIERELVAQPFDVEIVRAKIFVPSVESEMLEDNIAYVQLLTFSADTNRELRESLEELLAQNPLGLILDLRNNGGGFLDTAVEVSSEFISEGVILYEEFGDGSRTTYEALSGGLATEIPLVVLVNPGSASASEIVAGAIQDYKRGTLVGETTFGKGSVQISPELSNNQGALRVTIARWLTPNDRHIQDIGLEPDIVVERTEADENAGLDPQLDKAIEILSGN